MYNKKAILGFIPARGGSRGLPRKNILPLLGKPLIAWTIQQALAGRYFDKVIVNTDDEEIAKVSRQSGAEVPFMRPKELAAENTPIIDVIFHTLEYFNKQNIYFDYIALLEPTSPLRKNEDFDNASRALIENERTADSLVSVGKVHLEHPSIIKKINNGYVMPYEITQKNIYRRQDLEDVYFPYGVIYMSKTNDLFKYKSFYQERTIPYFIERWQNYEIDDEIDFIITERIMQKYSTLFSIGNKQNG